MKIRLSMILNELISEDLFLEVINHDSIDFENIFVSGKMKTDSKAVLKDDVFVCIKGFSVDGHIFAPEAYDNGAGLLIVNYTLDLPVLQVVVKDTRKATAVIAKILYDNPTGKFDLIGITGTNGKTTTSVILEQLYSKLGYKTGLIGTLGYKIGDKFYPSERTTPDIIELNEIFLKMVASSCKIVIMEVSSHALSLYRVYSLNFKIAVFTNLSQDHLDFHKDMEDYGNAKFTLFEMVQKNSGLSIVNIDDPFGHSIFKKIRTPKVGFSISAACQMPVKSKECEFWNISEIELKPNHAKFNLYVKNQMYARKYSDIKSSLSGKFNVMNLVAALIVVEKNIDSEKFNQLLKSTEDIVSATGRMEKVINSQNLDIYVDYAHTPDALSSILDTIREFTRKRVICVWGCGGNRDRRKRPLMAKISVKKADLTIITNDNPRFEFPADIIRDIIEPISYQESYIIIRDRAEAIKAAILLANEGDTVLIAGKGHETYQEIGSVKYHFDDKEEVVSALNNRIQYVSRDDCLAVPIDLLNFEKMFDISIKNTYLQDNLPLLTSVSTDSRLIQSNSIFFALNGENFNGEDFVKDIISKDSSNWCIINKKEDSDRMVEANKIFVSDSLTAYGRLAKKYLQLFKAKKIALTGSTGKTTTKEILYNILSEQFKTFKNAENENNKIGVPKNIFKMQADFDYAIFEIGTNQFGEINYLAEIIKPDFGLIISVNPSHLKYLKTLDLIFQEKMSMLNHVKDSSIIPSDDKRFNLFHKEYSLSKLLTFGYSDNADFKIVESEINEHGLCLKLLANNQIYIYQTSVKIPFYVENICVSVAMAQLLGVQYKNIISGLQKELSVKDRMQIYLSGNKRIIFDCYNANPFSMKAAIEYWMNLEPNRPHVAILGEMLELGDDSEKLHSDISELLSKNTLKDIIIYGVGDLSKFYKPDFMFDNVQELINSEIINKIDNNSVILVKGSHSVRLDKLKGIL